MLFTYRSLDDAEKLVENATTRIRAALRRYVTAELPGWTDLLACMTRARALAASNSAGGIDVSDEDAIAAIDREDPANADRDTWRAVVGYRQAMDYILQRRRSPSFTITEDVLLAVHFMICQSDMAANPGRYRPGWLCVRNTSTGDVVHEGVDRDRLEPLIHELLDYVNDGQVESRLSARGHDPPEPGDAASIHGRQRTDRPMHSHRRAGKRRDGSAGVLFH